MRPARTAMLAALAVAAGSAPRAHADAQSKPTSAVKAGRAALARVCRVLEKGKDQSIRRHVRIPLRVRRIVSENAGNPVARWTTLTTPRAVRNARLCRGLAVSRARIAPTKQGWIALAEIGQFDARLLLLRTRRGPRLISFRQPAE